MVALKRVFWYLNSTKDWLPRFRGALSEALGVGLGGEGECTCRCYVDSDSGGCPYDYKSTSGLVITFGEVVDWRSRKQKSTAHSLTDAEYYSFGVGCMRLIQISHLLNKLGILTIPHVFSDSQALIASIKNRIYSGTAVANIATKYYLVVDMTRDREINLAYLLTAGQTQSIWKLWLMEGSKSGSFA